MGQCVIVGSRTECGSTKTDIKEVADESLCPPDVNPHLGSTKKGFKSCVYNHPTHN